MARIIIEVPDSLLLGVSNHELRVLFADAVGEFYAHRTPIEDYVAARYPDTSAYAWLNREKKIEQVYRRCRIADGLHNNLLSLNIERS